jgi:mRNA interferase RelE/StbE
MAGRAGRRHPKAVRTVVRLTSDAVEDLERLMRKGDPQVVRWAFKKMIHLERNPEAGDAVLGGLIGWRKVTVDDRDWRLSWRVTHDDAGALVVDVAEVWAFGARTDAAVYEELEGRLAAASPTPHTRALADVLTTLGRLGDDLDATPEPAAREPPPNWSREAQLYVVRLPPPRSRR